jgi:uncharacterized protein (DUF302 family)
MPGRRRRFEQALAGAAMESYSSAAPYDETLKKLRRALSRRGFEILRECDLQPRMRTGLKEPEQCRILYVTEPELFATAIATHASAALWLPVPVVVCERDESVVILRPAEAIVRDRAALLGFRALVERSYQSLTEALAGVGRCDAQREVVCG